ncbi:hypothetical protein ACTXM3_14490 [Glutamicibacter arilaitensis]|uniref:hypothetical protein n=1 Tax=Glutamicibacter arilaitensis TaxID=256701 RepID=UPI003FD09785
MGRGAQNYLDNRDLALSREQLEALYERGKSPIALIDETYGTSNDEHKQPFYLLTAVLVEREDLKTLRDSLDSFETKAGFFHATEQFGQYPAKLTGFLRHINNSPVDSVVTVQTMIKDGNKNQARDDCLVRLAYELNRGTSPVQHLVLESLNQSSDPGRNHQDQLVVKRAASRGLLASEMSVSHASPYNEKLLWMPDVVSWAVRQELIHGNTQWVQNVETIRYVHAIGKDLTPELGAESGLKRRNSHVPQQNPGVRNLYGPKAGASSVSSPSIIEPLLEAATARQPQDPEAKASALASRLRAYRPTPEDRFVAGTSRRSEKTIVHGVQQYASEQVAEGARPRKSTEALIARIKASPQTSEPASAAIEDIMGKLQRIKQQQTNQRRPSLGENDRPARPRPDGPHLV